MMAAHQARRAVRLIDDLFDLCANAQDRLSLHKGLIELAEVVARATEATAHRLAARGHRLLITPMSAPWTPRLIRCVYC
jgi:hypothetical protein